MAGFEVTTEADKVVPPSFDRNQLGRRTAPVGNNHRVPSGANILHNREAVSLERIGRNLHHGLLLVTLITSRQPNNVPLALFILLLFYSGHEKHNSLDTLADYSRRRVHLPNGRAER
jgi:hypothetical protein